MKVDSVQLDPVLTKVFLKIDVDSSGKVSHPELFREIQEACPGTDVTEQEVLQLIRDYDEVPVHAPDTILDSHFPCTETPSPPCCCRCRCHRCCCGAAWCLSTPRDVQAMLVCATSVPLLAAPGRVMERRLAHF